MADKVFKEKEKNKPDKVFPTQTDNLVDFSGRDIVFEDMKTLEAWFKESKKQNRNLTIKCDRMTFQSRGAE